MMEATGRAGVGRETVAGFGVYVAVLTAAYYYNVTFVQLGLTSIGEDRLGLSVELVAAAMGLLAAATLTVTLVSGRLMDQFGLGTELLVKFRVLFGLLVLLLGVTALAPLVSTFPGFLALILGCSALLGTAIPFAFSLMLDLVSPGLRGYAAGTVAGGAFFLAALFPFEWAAGEFVPAAVVVLAPVVVLLGVLSLSPGAVAVAFDRDSGASPLSLGGVAGTVDLFRAPVTVGLVLLFGSFFVDSLGFVRIIETPAYVDSSWQSSERATRLAIAVTHVVGGLAAGVVYARRRYLLLFAASFTLFASAQLLYAYDIAVGGPAVLETVMPLVYVLAVACYTTVTFAIWPDLAEPGSVGTYTAVGIGIGGWLATFASTALALVSDQLSLGIGLHLLVVGLLSLLFVALTGSLWYLTADTGGQADSLRM